MPDQSNLGPQVEQPFISPELVEKFHEEVIIGGRLYTLDHLDRDSVTDEVYAIYEQVENPGTTYRVTEAEFERQTETGQIIDIGRISLPKKIRKDWKWLDLHVDDYEMDGAHGAGKACAYVVEGHPGEKEYITADGIKTQLKSGRIKEVEL